MDIMDVKQSRKNSETDNVTIGSLAQMKWGSWQIGGPRHYYRENRILDVISRLSAKGRLLDVGCGTGSLIMQLAHRGYEVHGVDMSEECVRRTSENLRLFVPEDHIDIKKGSAEKIDYPEGHFDIVIAAEVLEHVEKDDLTVREIHRVIKPGGVCVITVPANPALWDVSDDMAGHKRRYSKRALLSLFTAASFQVERVSFLGFPLMRLYHRMVFLRWAEYAGKKRGGDLFREGMATRVGLSRWSSLILGNLFRIDNLFSALPWGIGILLVARKGGIGDKT